MAPGKKHSPEEQDGAVATKAKPTKVARPAKASGDPNSPGMRLRRFIEQTLRADRGLSLPGLMDAANAWARQGHTHLGYKLWGGERPFGPHYLGLLLREDWAAKLGSEELRDQARFFRENPDKDLDDLRARNAGPTRGLRARDAEKRERQAREAAEKEERRKRPTPNVSRRSVPTESGVSRSAKSARSAWRSRPRRCCPAALQDASSISSRRRYRCIDRRTSSSCGGARRESEQGVRDRRCRA